MTKKQASELSNGLYTLHWKEGGASLAAVGRLRDGSVWFAPTNWISVPSTNWRSVREVTQLLFSKVLS